MGSSALCEETDPSSLQSPAFRLPPSAFRLPPSWQAIRQWIPADDDEPVFEWFDAHQSNESTWKPKEVPLDDERILVLDAD